MVFYGCNPLMEGTDTPLYQVQWYPTSILDGPGVGSVDLDLGPRDWTSRSQDLRVQIHRFRPLLGRYPCSYWVPKVPDLEPELLYSGPWRSSEPLPKGVL